MKVNLRKGQKVNLKKSTKVLKELMIGLGWDTNSYKGGYDFDLDASVFLLANNGKVITEEDFVFYGNLKHKSGAVEHTGDNRTGEGEGDDEVINILLEKIPKEIEKLVFTVTIYESDIRGQNFGQVSNSYIRVIDKDDNSEVLRYDLGEDFSIETAIIIAEIYRENGEWKFNAIGNGCQGGLEQLCRNYGVDVM